MFGIWQLLVVVECKYKTQRPHFNYLFIQYIFCHFVWIYITTSGSPLDIFHSFFGNSKKYVSINDKMCSSTPCYRHPFINYFKHKISDIKTSRFWSYAQGVGYIMDISSLYASRWKHLKLLKAHERKFWASTGFNNFAQVFLDSINYILCKQTKTLTLCSRSLQMSDPLGVIVHFVKWMSSSWSRTI